MHYKKDNVLETFFDVKLTILIYRPLTKKNVK